MVSKVLITFIFSICLVVASFLVPSTAGAVSSEVPAQIVRIAKGVNVIVVDKKSNRLLIYDDRLEIVSNYRVTLGKVPGDKKKRGDLKTPEGVYYFTSFIDGAELPAKYGRLALTTDYPNPVDRINRKTGSGIWIHATDDPSRLEKKRDSRGCVVVSNRDVIEIAEKVELLATPVVIVDGFDYTQPGPNRARFAAALKESPRLSDEIFSMEKGSITILWHGEVWVVSGNSGRDHQVYYLAEEEGQLVVLGKEVRVRPSISRGSIFTRMLTASN